MRMGLGITEFRQIAWVPPKTILSQNRASLGCWIFYFGFFSPLSDLNDRFQNLRMEMEMWLFNCCLLQPQCCGRTRTIMQVVLEGEIQACNRAEAEAEETLHHNVVEKRAET